jgi:hypothetical protein
VAQQQREYLALPRIAGDEAWLKPFVDRVHTGMGAEAFALAQQAGYGTGFELAVADTRDWLYEEEADP